MFKILERNRHSASKSDKILRTINLSMAVIHFNNNTMSEVSLAVTGWEEEEITEDPFMEEVKTYITFKLATFIGTYWYPILSPIGLIGNSLSFAVMMKPNNRKMSTCIYMAAISINDNLRMLESFYSYLVFGLQIREWHPIECKFNAFMSLFTLQNCTYLTVAMTIDKYIAIKWPHRAATYSTPRRTKWIVVGLYATVCLYNIPHPYLSSVVGGQCFNFGIRSVFSRVYSWLSFVVNAIIPFTLLIHMNYVIVKTVRISHKMHRSNGKVTRHSTAETAEKQLTIMLFLVTTLFLILLCPTYIRFIYLLFAKIDTPFQYANSMIFFQISSKLYTTNSGINFFLYCISGKKFRNDLKEILCCPNSSNVSALSSSTHPETNAVHLNTSSSIALN